MPSSLSPKYRLNSTFDFAVLMPKMPLPEAVVLALTPSPKNTSPSRTKFIDNELVAVVAICCFEPESNWVQVKTSFAALTVTSCSAGILRLSLVASASISSARVA